MGYLLPNLDVHMVVSVLEVQVYGSSASIPIRIRKEAKRTFEVVRAGPPASRAQASRASRHAEAQAACVRRDHRVLLIACQDLQCQRPQR